MKLVSIGIKDIIGFSTAWNSNLNRIVLYGYFTGGFQSIVGLCRNSSCSRFESSNNAFTADLCNLLITGVPSDFCLCIFRLNSGFQLQRFANIESVLLIVKAYIDN